ncbi:hypothetical protein AB2B41_14840 [Marimonas sp. MJW-29]|uniref:Uncharacterized protein n=1 Tax=Sulfitobacter sediminis TaxID=3234186 RepID=A0ABV3RRE2_9RHOB
MVQMPDIESKVAAVQDLLSEKFGVRKRPLPKMLQRTGRRLPRRMHARAQVLVEAQRLSANPKLAQMVDQAGVARAFDDLTAHLDAIDVADRRKGAILSVAAAVAFNILVVAGGFIFWLWWAGYV